MKGKEMITMNKGRDYQKQNLNIESRRRKLLKKADFQEKRGNNEKTRLLEKKGR